MICVLIIFKYWVQITFAVILMCSELINNMIIGLMEIKQAGTIKR